jgi:hypothetical protein
MLSSSIIREKAVHVVNILKNLRNILQKDPGERERELSGVLTP